MSAGEQEPAGKPDKQEGPKIPAPPDRFDVELGGKTVRLKPPKKLHLAAEVWDVYTTKSEAVAAAAALGLCWATAASEGWPKVRFGGSMSMQQYGRLVFNELLERGLVYNDIVRAGTVAVFKVADLLGVIEEAAESEGFTEAREPPSPT